MHGTVRTLRDDASVHRWFVEETKSLGCSVTVLEGQVFFSDLQSWNCRGRGCGHTSIPMVHSNGLWPRLRRWLDGLLCSAMRGTDHCRIQRDRQAHDGLASTAIINTVPRSTKTVPGKVVMSLEIRHWLDQHIATIDPELREESERGCTVDWRLDTIPTRRSSTRNASNARGIV